MSASTPLAAPRAPRRHLRRPLLGVVAAAMLVLTGCLSADQQADLDLINQARKANAKAALTADLNAAKKAQTWSQTMANTGVLEHSGGGNKIDTTGLPGACGIGENVGKGPSVAAVHKAFLESGPHKANILGRWTKAGTGVVKKGSTYWVTEIFIRPC